MFENFLQKIFSLNKKTLIILGIIILIFLIFLGISLRNKPLKIFKEKPSVGVLPETPTGTSTIITPKPITEIPYISTIEGVIEKVKPEIEIKKTALENISLPIFSSDEKNIFYFDKTTGKFFKSSLDGTNPEAISEKFYQVEKITWSSDRSKAALTFPDKSNIVFDLSNKKSYVLDPHIQEIDFSHKNNQIAYKYMDENPDHRYLMVSNFDGSEIKSIEHLGDNDKNVQVSWSPTNKVVALLKESVSTDNGEVYFIGLNGENYKSTLVPGLGFKAIWSPQGDKILYSVWSQDSDYKPSLWVVEADGDNIGKNRKDLGVYTFVEKCVWSKDNLFVFCAVPEDLEQGAGMVKELADSTQDSLWKIDIQTGGKTQIARNADLQGVKTIENLEISSDQKIIYFTDKKQGKLYQISLK